MILTRVRAAVRRCTLRGRLLSYAVSPAPARGETTQTPSVDLSDPAPPVRSDWWYIGWAVAAIVVVVGPIAALNELQTDVSVREWLESIDASVLPRLRQFIDIPYDEGEEARAASRPRGPLQLVDFVAFHVSGKRTLHTLPASTPETAALAAVADPDDPVVELVASDAVLEPAPYAGGPLGGRRTLTNDSSDLFAALFAFPADGLAVGALPDPLGALQTRASLLGDIMRVEQELMAVTQTIAEAEAEAAARPLISAVLREERDSLCGLLEGLRRQHGALGGGVGKVGGSRGASLAWRFASGARPSVSADPPARYFFSRGESARVGDRLVKIRRRLDHSPSSPRDMPA